MCNIFYNDFIICLLRPFHIVFDQGYNIKTCHDLDPLPRWLISIHCTTPLPPISFPNPIILHPTKNVFQCYSYHNPLYAFIDFLKSCMFKKIIKTLDLDSPSYVGCFYAFFLTPPPLSPSDNIFSLKNVFQSYISLPLFLYPDPINISSHKTMFQFSMLPHSQSKSAPQRRLISDWCLMWYKFRDQIRCRDPNTDGILQSATLKRTSGVRGDGHPHLDPPAPLHPPYPTPLTPLHLQQGVCSFC